MSPTAAYHTLPQPPAGPSRMSGRTAKSSRRTRGSTGPAVLLGGGAGALGSGQTPAERKDEATSTASSQQRVQEVSSTSFAGTSRTARRPKLSGASGPKGHSIQSSGLLCAPLHPSQFPFHLALVLTIRAHCTHAPFLPANPPLGLPPLFSPFTLAPTRPCRLRSPHLSPPPSQICSGARPLWLGSPHARAPRPRRITLRDHPHPAPGPSSPTCRILARRTRHSPRLPQHQRSRHPTQSWTCSWPRASGQLWLVAPAATRTTR